MVADLSWEIHLSDTQVWQREQIIMEVAVQAPDAFASLRADELTVPGMQVVPLPATRARDQDSGTYHLSIRWQLYPHAPGRQEISLPPIRYFLGGGTRARWQPPVQTIEVQALPPYLPPTLPVGEVTVETHVEPNGVLEPGTLSWWHVTLRSSTVTPAQFPPLLKQVHDTRTLDVLPARVSTGTDAETGEFRLDYQIPVKPGAGGRLDLPKLQWHWFDPDTDRLRKASYLPPRPWVLAMWQRIAIVLAVGLVLSVGAYRLMRLGRQRYGRWRSRHGVRMRLAGDGDVRSTRQAMAECARAHDWPSNLSTGQWLRWWERCYGEDRHLRAALQRHDARRFGGGAMP